MKRFLILFPALVLAFDFLFWNQSPGLNIFLFTLIVIVLTFWVFKESRNNGVSQVLAAGSFVASLMVFVHGAGWTVFTTVLSLSLFVVSAGFPVMRSALSLLFQSIVAMFTVPITFVHRVNQRFLNGTRLGKFGFFGGMFALPLLVAFLFYLLYLFGSPHFLEANSGVVNWIATTFKDFSWSHFWFVVMAGWICVFVLRKSFVDIGVSEAEKYLRRERIRNTQSSTMGLRKEALAGVILLVLLNAMLLVVNYIDINTVWFSFVVPKEFSLKQFVHNGTWILSICILLSMFIVIWFFRKNQNFYSKTIWLKRLSILWIVQNMILAFSVFMRNYYYINWHGLAYGRIFVIVFLVVVMIALTMMILKVRRKYSSGYFVRFNSWVAYAAMVACSFPNWDSWILDYNLKHDNIAQIDFGYYQKLSGDLYPEIYKNQNNINQQLTAHRDNDQRWVHWANEEEYWRIMNLKRDEYFRELVAQEWQSWTLNNRNSLEQIRVDISKK